MTNPMDDSDCLQATENNRGHMFNNISDVSRAFIEFAATAEHPVVDMGCAYGVATLPVVRQKRAIIACDLDQRHLDKLSAQVPEACKRYLSCQQGRFPGDFDFDDASISAVHMSHMLHFLSGAEILQGLGKIKRWLVPGGKLFLTLGTPYVHMMSFAPEFERRIAAGHPWPGEMDAADINRYFSAQFRQSPEKSRANYVHLFNIESLQPLLLQVGFTIEKLAYYQPVFPPDLEPILGGKRAWLCAIVSR